MNAAGWSRWLREQTCASPMARTIAICTATVTNRSEAMIDNRQDISGRVAAEHALQRGGDTYEGSYTRALRRRLSKTAEPAIDSERGLQPWTRALRARWNER